MLEKLNDYFPLPSAPRPKQALALDFIHKAVEQGYQDIVIAAPTGIGKTGIGMAACLWGNSAGMDLACGEQGGGYYLVTQKMLQDQIENDFNRFPDKFKDTGVTLKTASEYVCPSHVDCATGHTATTSFLEGKSSREPLEPQNLGQKPKLTHCHCLAHYDSIKSKWTRREDRHEHCPYERNKSLFVRRPIGVTNYAYWLSERAFVKAFPVKNILVADECHSIERQLLSFIELNITPVNIAAFSTGVSNPPIERIEDFVRWAEDYREAVEIQYDVFEEKAQDDPHNRVVNKKFKAVENHLRRINAALKGLETEPENWVYWCDQTSDKRGFVYVLKPLDAAPSFKKLIVNSSIIRIYLSAYPGPKDIFCRTLGLDPAKVAWQWISSTFPLANRPIHLNLIGSMSKSSYDSTLPQLLHTCQQILSQHPDTKGLIHCHTYKLGQAIFDHLQDTPHANRIIFPGAAGDRAAQFDRHRHTDEPTVMLSPSMTEGFSLDEDLARFQIIAKMPYPYLGDRQVKAKMERDEDWYTLQTVQSLIQATGRIVRSDTDFGATYILDSDFNRLLRNNLHFFPKWWTDALIRY